MGINVQTIRSSFELVRPATNQLAELFYEFLFRDYPDAKGLFAQVDMQMQKKALIDSLVAVVDNLDNPGPLTKFLIGLGQQHSDYGAEDIHYEWVGASLLKAFKQCLGDKWTPHLQSQWEQVYGIMSEAMKSGVRSAPSKIRPLHRKQERETTGRETVPDVESPISGIILPDTIKQHIHTSIDRIIHQLVRAEVKRYIEEQMRNISHMSPEDLVKKAI